MRKLFHLTIANPVVVLLLVGVAVWSGIFALLHLPTGLFPGLDVPVVNVISHYAGASAENMELLITRPIEQRLRAIPGIRRVSSTSIEGVSQITTEFDWGTRLADARQLVQAEVSSVQTALPTGVQPRLENIGTTLQEVAGYVVVGGNPIETRRFAKIDLTARLMDVDGVSRVEVLGGDDPAWIVQLRPEAMLRQQLTIRDVTSALADHNLMTAEGFINRGSREYLIRGDSRLQTPEDLRAVPVTAEGPRSVFLKDVADVHSGKVPRHYRIYGDGQPATAFVISKQPGAGTTRVVEKIDRKLADMQALLPSGARIEKYYDQSEIVAEAGNALFYDLILGAVLAAAVLFFFMGTFRATLIVTAAIPLTLLATLAIMKVFGQTLNMITLSALTLAVGMVVDDSIVVTESIVRHLKAGRDRRTAAETGAAEIAGPDASGTFTTIAAFAPLLFLGGIAGLFVKPFGLTLSAALLVSLIVSLTFVPVMLGRTGHPGRRKIYGARLLAAADRTLQRLLKTALAHRGRTILLSVLILGLGGLAVLLGPVSILPPVDEGALLIEYILPPGTSLKESNRIGMLLEQQALAQPDVETVCRRTGSPEQGFQIEGVNRGEMVIKLASHTARRRTADQILEALREAYSQIPCVAYLFHQPTQEKMDESLSGLPALFGVTLFGPDTSELIRLAAQVEQRMTTDSGLANIINNTKIKSPQILVHPNPVELARCGLSPADIFDAIHASQFGIAATTCLLDQQPVQVLVKTGSQADETIDRLKELVIATPSGKRAPLRQVADVQISHRPAAITHLNGQRNVTVLAEVKGSIPAAVKRLQKLFQNISLPNGYSLAFTGQYQILRRTILDFAFVGLAAVLLIYLIMALQFRSWYQPLIILITVPFALVGAIVLLAVSRVGIDISVGLGAVTLIGIAVNNAIVLADYANRQVAAGQALPEALQTATSIRLRPILMTAATTIFALIPVAINPAIGSRIFQPFAVAVIGGLLTSTISTLVLVPVLATFGRKTKSQN